MGPADLIASVRGRAEIVAYRGGWGAVRRMPAGAAYAAFERIADIQARRGGKGIDRMRANYARVRPQLDDVALDFPDLTLIAYHAGWPYTEELIALCGKHKNLYLSLSGVFGW